MKTYCYIRVSTDKQTYERQEFLLQNKGYIDGVNCTYIEETGTGKSMEKRDVLNDLLENVIEEGDTLVATDISRISRSIIDFKSTIDLLLKVKKVNVILLKENLELLCGEKINAMVNMQINMIGLFAEFERDLISERTIEKLAYVKEHGSKSGKPIGKPRSNKNTQEKFVETLELIINGDSLRDACNKTLYPLGTFTYNIKKYKNELNTKDYNNIYNAIKNGDVNYG